MSFDRADAPGQLDYVMVELDHAEGLVALERLAFPTADEEELLTARGVRSQCETFPEGGFVVLDGDRVVGMGMGIFVDFDLDQPQHHIDEVVGSHGSDFHDPLGRWYYGTDIAVHPDYRGQGIGRRLYDLRKGVVVEHNRAGIIAGGVIPGFAKHKHAMSAADYVKRVTAGELYDPTLSFQIENGFEARGVIADYWGDPAVDNWASFIVWHNPDFDREAFDAERARAGRV